LSHVSACPIMPIRAKLLSLFQNVGHAALVKVGDSILKESAKKIDLPASDLTDFDVDFIKNAMRFYKGETIDALESEKCLQRFFSFFDALLSKTPEQQAADKNGYFENISMHLLTVVSGNVFNTLDKSIQSKILTKFIQYMSTGSVDVIQVCKSSLATWSIDAMTLKLAISEPYAILSKGDVQPSTKKRK
jgi:hypothetical protein